MIDLFGLSEVEVRDRHPAIYQHLKTTVQPARDGQAAKSDTADARKYAEDWWLFGKTRPEIRKALAGLDRYIVTIETAKHRVFQFLSATIVPDNMLVCVASGDAFDLAVLSSRSHCSWALAAGARLGVGNDPRYSKSRCFDPFPFPADVPEPLKNRIRAEADALDALRKRVLAANDDLTLTKLYNVLEALRAADRGGAALTAAEREIHDRGLVTLIRQHHDAIDALVAKAYGWPLDHATGRLTDDEILIRLVALNRERAVEEARGLVRHLRPAFQDPGHRTPITAALDLSEAVAMPSDDVIPWPATLPEQVGAVQSILAVATLPMAAQDIARSFKGKRASTVRPVLDALAGLGMARRLGDGRYAA